MNFWIQVGSPALNTLGEEAADMPDALSELYPMDTEYVIVSWNRVPVAIPYDSVDVLVDDVVRLLECLSDPEFSEMRIHWGDSDFNSVWEIRQDGPDLSVESRWESVVGGYEFLLNERGRLDEEKGHFVGEWEKLLRKLVDDLREASARMEDDALFRRAQALVGSE